jgi:serine/threonine protein kinase
MMRATLDCHDRGLLHCDIRPENFVETLCSRKGRIALIDFERAKPLEKFHSTKAPGSSRHWVVKVISGHLGGKTWNWCEEVMNALLAGQKSLGLVPDLIEECRTYYTQHDDLTQRERYSLMNTAQRGALRGDELGCKALAGLNDALESWYVMPDRASVPFLRQVILRIIEHFYGFAAAYPRLAAWKKLQKKNKKTAIMKVFVPFNQRRINFRSWRYRTFPSSKNTLGVKSIWKRDC